MLKILLPLLLAFGACSCSLGPGSGSPEGGAAPALVDAGNLALFEAVRDALEAELPSTVVAMVVPVDEDSISYSGAAGVTYFSFPSGSLVAEVRIDLPAPTVWETLAHEWAHVLRWACGGCQDAHDEAWGVLYSRCYRVALAAAQEWHEACHPE